MTRHGDYTRTEQEWASKDYPATELGTGQRLHVCYVGGGWEVWLNRASVDFDGLVIGTGETRDEAIAEAVRALEAAEAHL